MQVRRCFQIIKTMLDVLQIDKYGNYELTKRITWFCAKL